MYGWRVHQEKPTQFRWCQDFSCPETHYIHVPFYGTRPLKDPWDGMLDSDGKIGK